MIEMMECTELVIDNKNNTTINDAIGGLLTAEAAINTMVSLIDYCSTIINASNRTLMKLILNCPIEQPRRYDVVTIVTNYLVTAAQGASPRSW